MIGGVLSDEEMEELAARMGLRVTKSMLFVLLDQDLYRRTDQGWERYDGPNGRA